MMPRIVLLALLTGLAFILSLMAGPVWIGPGDWLSPSINGWILVELRLPRAILGLLIGASLGLAGAVLQGFLRNPLADPTVVGVSSSAGLGGVIAIFFGWSGLAMFVSAMAAAMAAVLTLALLAARSGTTLGFILAGMVLSTAAGAATAFLISIAPSPFATAEIMAWMMGALTDRGLDDVWHASPFIAVGLVLLFLTGRSLDALTLGEDAARSLGVRMGRLKLLVVGGTGLCVGAAVAVSGVVGFVGLIVPHVMRRFVGERPSALLLPSMLGGATLTLVADSVVRLMPGAAEPRLGIIMAALGAPFFFLLLLRRPEVAP